MKKNKFQKRWLLWTGIVFLIAGMLIFRAGIDSADQTGPALFRNYRDANPVNTGTTDVSGGTVLPEPAVFQSDTDDNGSLLSKNITVCIL
jgi:hypothetical protein